MSFDSWERPFELLVVDDESFVRETLAIYLEGEGCVVHSAATGERALEIAASEPIETAIVDIRMPGMDGLTLLSEIKRRHPDIEVLMATGFQSLETAVEAMRRGACDYITKPFTDLENDLLRFVVRAVERRRLRLGNRELTHGLQTALQELGGARDDIARGGAALRTLEEFGARVLQLESQEEVLETFLELCPRIAPIESGHVQLREGSQFIPVRTIGSDPAPVPEPPAEEDAGPGTRVLIVPTVAGGTASGHWCPLWGGARLLGWFLWVPPAGADLAELDRLALRALCDQFAATLAALAGPPTRTVENPS